MPPLKPAKVIVFLNQQSGSATGMSERILAGFQSRHLPCEIVRIEPGLDVAGRAHKAAAQQDMVVVAAGGDGTVNSVAAGLARTGAPMGVVPAGTLNHFARDLDLPLELDKAIEVIAAGHRSTVDTAEVNGRFFVNNSSVGIYSTMVAARERLQRSGDGKWLSLMLASWRAFVRFHHLTLKLTIDGQQITRRTPIVFIGNNDYKVGGTEAGSRERLDAGTLCIYLTPGLTRLGTLQMAFATLFGRVKELSDFECHSATECIVDLHRGVCEVSLDGEVCRMDGPLHYRIRPKSLIVCTPGGA
ncbi:MAG: hypothetical protein M3R43_08860 [Acidobacteriota bacterium]|nr:hypothetical protein [Acidobacteriota bacterium]